MLNCSHGTIRFPGLANKSERRVNTVAGPENIVRLCLLAVQFRSMSELIESEDFYWEGPYMVFTAQYHLRKGQCCGSGCRHCPYEPRGTKGTTTPAPEFLPDEAKENPIARSSRR